MRRERGLFVLRIVAGPKVAFAFASALVTGTAIVCAAATQAWCAPGRFGESGLPGRTAVLYRRAVDARAACSDQHVVFVDVARGTVSALDAASGRDDGAALPDRGFGCLDDVRTDRLVRR